MNFRQYMTNQGLYWRGIRWLWTREYYELDTDRLPRLSRLRGKYQAASTERPHLGIHYRKGWGPWRFLPVYLTSYLLSTLLGHPIRPFSGILWERATVDHPDYDGEVLLRKYSNHISVGFVRFLDWITRDPEHCAKAAKAPTLWGSRGCRQ